MFKDFSKPLYKVLAVTVTGSSVVVIVMFLQEQMKNHKKMCRRLQIETSCQIATVNGLPFSATCILTFFRLSRLNG